MRRGANGSQKLKGWSKAGGYVYAFLLVLAVTFLGRLISGLVLPSNVVMLYLLAVMSAALRWGHGPSILAAVLGGLTFDFFFIPPHLTFAIADTQYLLTFVALIAVGLVISTLVARAQDEATAAQRREAQAAALYRLSRDLAAANDLNGIADAVLARVVATFGQEAALFLDDGNGLVNYRQSPGFALGVDDMAAATWAFHWRAPAGSGTRVQSAANAQYVPMLTVRGAVGVLGVMPPSPDADPAADQHELLESFARQAAVALERAQLADAARRTQLLQATEKLQTALNSVSHDLRTPLASITGALTSLLDDEVELEPATRRSLVETAREEADRLNRLVGNLLHITRIEGGALHVTQHLSDVQELVGAALEQIGPRALGLPLTIDVPPDLPPIPVDFVLITQVLVNLIDNAIKFSPPGAPVTIQASTTGAEIRVEIADRGSGVPAQDLQRVFDKFYRVQQPGNVRGTGLGLAISKGIVEAHGGRIWLSNRPGGGVLATIALPLAKRTPEGKTAA